MNEPRLPAFFLSHGGGPWPWLPGPYRDGHAALAAAIAAVIPALPQPPRALLIATAHWEAPDFTVSSHPHPPMLYDYYGFPEATYAVRYPAPGSPALAARITALLGDAGIAAAADGARGFDHGTFVVAQVMRPAADLPVVQLSLRADYDPAAHLAAGRALAPLRDEGVLIVGSGLSYHNLRLLGPAGRAPSAAFDAWLRATLRETAPAAREAALLAWADAPAARIAHPREDHLLPLFTAAGAADGDPAACIYHEDDFLGGVSVSSFLFG